MIISRKMISQRPLMAFEELHTGDMYLGTVGITGQPMSASISSPLNNDGCVKTSICSISDEYGWEVENTPMNQMRVTENTRLVGATFGDGTTLDSNFWASGLGSGAAVTASGGQLILSTGAAASTVVCNVTSVRTARYIGANANYFRAVVQIPDAGVVNNNRRWGAFNTTDGAFFDFAGSVLNVTIRKSSSDTPTATTYIPSTGVHTYEIYWTNSKVWFTIDGALIATISAPTAPWCNTMNLPVRLETSNVGVQQDVQLKVRVATINRLGPAQTMPTYAHVSGAVTNRVLKLSAGTLHGIVINTAPNNSTILIADSSSTNTPVIASITVPAGMAPTSLDYNLPFSSGLSLTTTGNALDLTLVYE